MPEWEATVMYLGNLYQPQTKHLTYPIYNNRRFTHTYIIGKTGMGKSTLLENLAIQDIRNGDGIAFFDPHGDSIDTIMRHIPPENAVLFDPTDDEFPIAFNPLHQPYDIAFTVSALLDTLKTVWKIDADATPNIDQYLLYGLTALAYAPDGTLFGFKYFLNSEKYRNRVLGHVKDKFLVDFWRTDFEELMPKRDQRASTLSTLNKFASLFIDPRMRCIFGQPKTTLKLQDIMEKGKSLLIKLPQGRLGIKKSATIGALLMAQLHITALNRENRRPFHIYADEAHHFGNTTLQEMLSGVRKFGVSLVLANQYLNQFSPELRSAILGTIGSIVAFPIGTEDAEVLGKEMGIDPSELVEQNPFFAWVKSDTVSDTEMFDIYHPVYEDSPRQIEQCTRNQYGRKRLPVEWKLEKFMRNAL